MSSDGIEKGYPARGQYRLAQSLSKPELKQFIYDRAWKNSDGVSTLKRFSSRSLVFSLSGKFWFARDTDILKTQEAGTAAPRAVSNRGLDHQPRVSIIFEDFNFRMGNSFLGNF
jgi:hypothetical protein